MDTLMVGGFAINLLVGVSMKQILKAIRVFQIIAFFPMLAINYPPESLIFLQAINQFSTFKIVPAQILEEVINFLGLGDEDSDELNLTVFTLSLNTEDTTNFDETRRLLIEEEASSFMVESMGYTSDSNMFKNLNSILLAFIGFLFLIFILIIFRFLIKKYQVIQKLYTKISQTVFFSSVHAFMNTAAIPVQVTAMFELSSVLDNGDVQP